MILTLACGKYRFNKRDFGRRGRDCRVCLISAGAATRIQRFRLRRERSAALGDSIVVSAEGRRDSVTLLYLEIKNIRIGPSLPAFVTRSFQVAGGEKDLAAILAPA